MGNNKIKWILIVIIIALLIFLGFRFFRKEQPVESNFTEISLEKYTELLNSSDQTIIYISSKNDFSKEYEENIKTVLKQKDTKIYYLDLSKLKGEDIVTFMNANELTKDNYVEPMILVIKDSQIKDKILGVVPKAEIMNFLDKYVD